MSFVLLIILLLFALGMLGLVAAFVGLVLFCAGLLVLVCGLFCLFVSSIAELMVGLVVVL